MQFSATPITINVQTRGLMSRQLIRARLLGADESECLLLKKMYTIAKMTPKIPSQKKPARQPMSAIIGTMMNGATAAPA